MDFFEEMGLFAIGGWFDTVNGNKKYSISMSGITNSLKFINDYPSLLISKGDEVVLWKFKDDNLLKFQEEGKDFIFSQITPVGIVAIEKRENSIYLFSYKYFFFSKKYNPSKTEIWGMDYAENINLLFSGSSSGFLYSVNVKKDEIRNYQLHTQGITSILALGNNLITASDDKAISVWELPEMKVAYRTKGTQLADKLSLF